MTYDEALEWFALHGNVAKDTARLGETRPTMAALRAAARVAVGRKGRPEIEAIDAVEAINTHWSVKDGAPLR